LEWAPPATPYGKNVPARPFAAPLRSPLLRRSFAQRRASRHRAASAPCCAQPFAAWRRSSPARRRRWRRPPRAAAPPRSWRTRCGHAPPLRRAAARSQLLAPCSSESRFGGQCASLRRVWPPRVGASDAGRRPASLCAGAGAARPRRARWGAKTRHNPRAALAVAQLRSRRALPAAPRAPCGARLPSPSHATTPPAARAADAHVPVCSQAFASARDFRAPPAAAAGAPAGGSRDFEHATGLELKARARGRGAQRRSAAPRAPPAARFGACRCALTPRARAGAGGRGGG
jgi:hypothetical protein